MNESNFVIAIIEDDVVQLENLTTAIKSQGFTAQAFETREAAEKSFDQGLPDMVISDIILGSEMDGGFELAKHLLSFDRPIPVIFLSERQSEFDIYTGHALGAVDYLPKPIVLNVLIAKIKNLLRISGNPQPSEKAFLSRINGLEFNLDQFKAYWNEEPLNLTATEFEMLKQFAQTGEKGVVTYDSLQESTQGVVERNTINTHICRIRTAFRKVDDAFNLIHNEYGRGYSWYQK